MATPNFPSKRHISFYSNKEYTSVCRGINLKSRCTNPACESVRSMGGLVIVKCPDRDTCVYQDAVYDLPCPSCGTVLSPMQFSGIVFVRCEASVSIGDKSELIKANQEETVWHKMEYNGPEVRIRILEREPERNPPPAHINNQEYRSPTNGVNLVATCHRNDCLAFRSNEGRVVVRIGMIESAVFQELTKHRSCPCCNHGLDVYSFSAVTFQGCRAEVEIDGRVEIFEATSLTKYCEIEAAGPRAVVRVNRDPVAPLRSPPLDDSRVRGPFVNSCPMTPEIATPGAPLPPSRTLAIPNEIPAFADFSMHDFGIGDITVDTFKKMFEFILQNVPPDKALSLGDLGLGALGLGDRPLSEVSPNALTQGLQSFLQNLSSGNPDFSDHVPDALKEIENFLPSQMESGINFMAGCPNPECGSVVIPSGHIVSCRFKEAIRGMTCPSCNQGLPPNCFTGVGFLKCKATVQTSKKKSLYQAGLTTEICEILDETYVEISVLERDCEVFSHTGRVLERLSRLLAGKSGKEYTVACPGLNIVARCLNRVCAAYVENGGLVNITAPGVDVCILSSLFSDLGCPSCSGKIEFSQVEALTFLRCRGAVIIGDQLEKFSAGGDHTVDFIISPSGPAVMINISFKVKEKKDQSPSNREYTKICDGVNFTAFCENPDCLSVQEYNGYVIVIRNEVFVERNGFTPNRCNYSVEIQHLNCPSCGSRLDPEIARGVALVRCKGVIEIAGKRQNFEAKMNDFVQLSLDHSDPRTVVEYKVVNVLRQGPGLTVTFRCPNITCHAANNGLFCLNLGMVAGFRMREVMLTQQCPLCNHNIPIDKIVSILFNSCTAEVRINGEEIIYLTGSCVQDIPFKMSDTIEVDTLSIMARDVSKMLTGYFNPFFSMNTGLNVQAICSNSICEAKQMHEGRVCISCPESKNSQLSELLSLLFCPSCNSPLSDMLLICLSFVQCKALIESSEKKYLIEAAVNEVIDLEGSLLSPDLSIQVLSLKEDFPELKKQHFNKGSEYTYASLCHGLNFRASCPNPTCVSVQNRQYVNIMSGHLLDFDYRLAVQSLTCPCCSTPIFPEDVDGVTMLYCTGQVKIGERIERLDYSGNNISRISIPNDGSNVWIKIEHRTYNVFTRSSIAYFNKPFQSLCRGVNFRCYCKNALCDSFNLRDGLVHVQRNIDFVNTHGYSHNVCNYRDEISRLRCPDCSVPLPQYFVWGVVLSCCSGTITRNGSPPEKFCTPSGKVVLYALDRDDRSAYIEFSL